jgi:hypothetical protein
MRNVRILGVSLIAVFAFSAVAATAAFAENAPVFVRCATAKKEGKKYTGRYTNKECTKEATSKEKEEGKKNKYESTPLADTEKVAVTGKSKTTTIKAKGVNGKAESVVCKKDKFAGDLRNTPNSGQLTSPVFTFEGCEANASKTEVCGNVKAGTIEYAPGDNPALRWLASEETDAGIVSPTGPDFTCGSETVELSGVLVGAVENTSKGVSLVWKVSGGHQEHTSFFSEESEETGYYWYSEPSEAEATVEGKEELTAKGISAAKAS